MELCVVGCENNKNSVFNYFQSSKRICIQHFPYLLKYKSLTQIHTRIKRATLHIYFCVRVLLRTYPSGHLTTLAYPTMTHSQPQRLRGGQTSHLWPKQVDGRQGSWLVYDLRWLQCTSLTNVHREKPPLESVESM